MSRNEGERKKEEKESSKDSRIRRIMNIAMLPILVPPQLIHHPFRIPDITKSPRHGIHSSQILALDDLLYFPLSCHFASC